MRLPQRDSDAMNASIASLRSLDARVGVDAQRLVGLIARETNALLGGLTVAYRPARAVRDWVVGASGACADILTSDLASAAVTASEFFLYDPLRPRASDRNTVRTTEHDNLPADSAAFFDRLDKGIGQSRVLVCDGPILLAWIGILRPAGAASPSEARVLRKLGSAMRRPLRLALAIPPGLKSASFEASLEAYGGEAYVTLNDLILSDYQWCDTSVIQPLSDQILVQFQDLTSLTVLSPGTRLQFNGYVVPYVQSPVAADIQAGKPLTVGV